MTQEKIHPGFSDVSFAKAQPGMQVWLKLKGALVPMEGIVRMVHGNEMGFTELQKIYKYGEKAPIALYPRDEIECVFEAD